MSKSNKYGYVGVDIPEQSFGNNKGIFNPAEINELVADNKWTQYGQLELIHTETITSSTSAIDFKVSAGTWDNTYDVHFVTYNNLTFTNSTQSAFIQLFDNTETIISGAEYSYALQQCDTNGSFTANKPPYLPYQAMLLASRTTNQTSANREYNNNGYFYVYNSNNSYKYSYLTSHHTGWINISGSLYYCSLFGSGMHQTSEEIYGIRFMNFGTPSWNEGTISIYGIRSYG